MKPTAWTLVRYIATNVIGGIGLALLLLVGLDLLFALIGETGDIGKGSYSMAEVMLFLGLTAPRRAVDLYPTAALVGTLLGLGALSAGSELVAMRAAGISRMRISVSAVVASLLLLVPVLLVSEYVVPTTEPKAQGVRVMAQTSRVALAQRSGIWVRDGNSFINARRPISGEDQIVGEVRLADLHVYEFDSDQRLVNTAHAETARHDGSHWTLEGIRRTTFSADRIRTEDQATEVWPSLINPDLIQVAIARPQYLALREQLAYIDYLDENGLDARPYRAAFWARLAFPLSALAMVFTGMPFVFGLLRSGGLGVRIVLGMGLGFTFFMFSRMLVSLGQVYSLNPAAVALLPPIGIAVIVALAIRRSG